MRALSDVLWRERDLLELLVHRLEVERALLETGRTARIALAARETEDVLEQYRTAELGRAAEAAASARALGRPEDASLADLAQAAQGPWGDILHEHRSALRELVAQVETLTRALPGSEPGDTSERLLGSVRDTLDASVDAELADAVIDLQLQELSRRAVEARAQLVHRGLVDFLR